jgi:hypothetical protein
MMRPMTQSQMMKMTTLVMIPRCAFYVWVAAPNSRTSSRR